MSELASKLGCDRYIYCMGKIGQGAKEKSIAVYVSLLLVLRCLSLHNDDTIPYCNPNKQ